MSTLAINRRRRWRQFSLRSLLAAVFLASLGLAFWRAYVRPYQVQRRAADKLSALGASLDWEPTGPAWLPWLTGRQFPLEIVRVDLDGRRKVKDEDLACLADLRSLRGLHLGSTRISESTLRAVSRLPHVQRVSLWKTPIGDEGMQWLSRLPELEKLDIHLTRVGDAGLEHLSHSPSLAWLDIGYNTRITAEGLRHLARLPTLRELNFRGAETTADHIANLRGSRIERLQVDCVRDDALDELAGLTNLRRLPYLESTIGTPQRLQQFRRLLHLESLWATPRLLGPGGTEHLLPFRNLEELTLCGTGDVRTPVTAEDIARLAQLPRLRSLNLEEANVDDDALRPIGALAGLRRLNLRKTHITDAALAYVADLADLEELDLSETDVSDAGLAHLRGLTKLRRLTCTSERVTDAGLDHLFGLDRLESLNFCGTKITYDKAKLLHDRVPGCAIEDAWCCGCMSFDANR